MGREPASRDLCVGVDGGGTRTRAVAVDGRGQVVARAAAGPGNFQLVGLDGVADLIEGLLRELGAQHGAGDAVASLGVGLAGAGRRPEQVALEGRLDELGRSPRTCVVSDARAALEGAHGGGVGIIAICGTGSMVLGKSGSGEEVRAGGLGPLLGDEASGYRLVLEAMRAVLRARDGAGEDTSLSAALSGAFGLTGWDEAIGRVYGGDLTRDRIAAAAPHFFAAVRQGDAVAARILASEARALGRQVAAVAARLDVRPVDVACIGGVFHEAALVWPPLAGAAAAAGQEIRRVEPQLEPVLGAALLARRAADLPVSAAFFDGLRGHGPLDWG